MYAGRIVEQGTLEDVFDHTKHPYTEGLFNSLPNIQNRVCVNPDEHTVTANGQRVELTYKEFEVLRLFLQHPGMAFTRDQLMEKVWGMDYYGETRTVDMHIRTLRQKLGACGDHIETVRGVGYRWEGTK